MNILDIKDSEVVVPGTDGLKIKGIFDRQKFLHDKYKGIEIKNGIGLALVDGIPFSIDNPKWQYIIKDFAWRITEELTEAYEAHELGHETHTIEELIDALHFYTELLIVCGISSDDIPMVLQLPYKFGDSKGIFDSIYPIGIACNLLKNKPWKNTHVVTDVKRFNEHLISGYSILLSVILKYSNITLGDLYMAYYKKSLVNVFRQDSNY